MASHVSPLPFPDLPATFESLNDDTLTTVLEFVGDKSYRTFGGINKHCKEIYITSGMTKETFLYGYAPLPVIQDRPHSPAYSARYAAVGIGVVLYNRRDVLAWAIQDRKKSFLLSGICKVAAKEGRLSTLNEVWNNVNDNERYAIFLKVDRNAAIHGKLNVLKWLETKRFVIDTKECAKVAAKKGRIHIIQWLIEQKGLKLEDYLYSYASRGNQLNVLKWLREQEVPWGECTFAIVASQGKLDVLQWLHDEGCPWDPSIDIDEEYLWSEVIHWLLSNGYGDRIVVGNVSW